MVRSLSRIYRLSPPPGCGGEFCVYKLLRFSYNRWHPCVDYSTVTRTTHSSAAWQDHMPLWLHWGMAGTPISCPLHRISVSSQDHRFPLCCDASVVSLAHLDALLATASMPRRPTWARKNNRLLHLMHWEVFEVLLLLTMSWYMNDKRLILLLCSHGWSPKVLDQFLPSLVL